jgi:hypothetical protein
MDSQAYNNVLEVNASVSLRSDLCLLHTRAHVGLYHWELYRVFRSLSMCRICGESEVYFVLECDTMLLFLLRRHHKRPGGTRLVQLQISVLFTKLFSVTFQ